ncbi:MAG: tetraacyldisaccharide 4'-kinase [Salibacteraceae bacterium]
MLRNALFDAGVFTIVVPSVKSIGVGNLRVGGTGKTPMVEFLLNLINNDAAVAVLSRGYGRKSSGYLVADATSTAIDIGDEPAQIKKKFPSVAVAVDGSRVNGINKLQQSIPELKAIILDDVYQHRHVKPGLMLLLTRYDDLYCDDYLLPVGMLREPSSNAKRADVIIVTKCPRDMSDVDRDRVKAKLNPEKQQKVLFSRIGYDIPYNASNKRTGMTTDSVILVSGIEDPREFISHAESKYRVRRKFIFKDHHQFSASDLRSISESMQKFSDAVVLTTEKDWQRLRVGLTDSILDGKRIFIQPVKTEFINDDQNAIKNIIDEYLN